MSLLMGSMPARVGSSSTMISKVLLLLGDFFLLEVEGFFVVLLAGEDADVDVVGEGHGGFVAGAVGLDLLCLDGEGDFVFLVGGLDVGGGEGLVVVEDDVLEGVGDVVLVLGRGVRRGGRRRTGGCRGRELSCVVVWRWRSDTASGSRAGRVELVFADVVGEAVEDERTLLIPDVGFVLDEDEGVLVADLAGAAAEIAVELVGEELVHVVGAVLLLHDAEGGVLGEGFGHHVGAFDVAADELDDPTTGGRARAR